MKKFFLLLVMICFSLVYGQTKPIDTAQRVVPDRVNSVEAMKKPYVIMISADGYRSDYSEKYGAENVLRLASQGVQAKAMLPSFPSITFPNHWSLITGMYPSHHGLVDNFFYDPNKQAVYFMNKTEIVEDGSWYGGTPLWALAEKNNVISASLQWVGSASDAGGARPTYYYPYHEKFTPNEKVAKVVNWLKLPQEKRPHFIALYFPEVDGAGHHFGPEAAETKNAVKLVDAAIGKLVEEVNALGLQNVNFVFVSDHGMLGVDKDNPIDIPEILADQSKYQFFNGQTLLRVFVKNPMDVKPTFHQLKKNATGDYKVYLNKRFPRKLHYGFKDDTFQRIGQIILVPKAPKIFLEKGKKTTVGKHGYDPKKVPEMKAVFYAWGPAFQKGLVIDEFRNVNVYPLVAEVLELPIPKNIDGKQKVLEKTLKK